LIGESGDRFRKSKKQGDAKKRGLSVGGGRKRKTKGRAGSDILGGQRQKTNRGESPANAIQQQDPWSWGLISKNNNV